MSARTPSWEPVETFGAWASEQSQLRLVDSAVASAALDCQRFQSTTGERAILLPVRSVSDGADKPISVADLSDDVTGLLFVDPPSAATAQGLVRMLGEQAASIRLALTEDADSAGLAADTGRVTVTVGLGSTLVYRLYRPDLAGVRRLPPGPRPGESVDVLDQRSKWFTNRHGRS